jgi:hypothetical protein
VFKQLTDKFPFILRADVYQEALYLLLEKDHEHDKTDIHKPIEYRTGQSHIKDFGGQYPDDYKCQDTIEEAQGAAIAHHLV